MKLLLILTVLIQTITFAQEGKETIIQLIEGSDSFPDCKTYFYANGQFSINKQELPEIDLPNTTTINPIESTWNDVLIFHSYAQEAYELGSIEFDKYQINPISDEGIKELILASPNKANYEYMKRNYDYLRKDFGIVRDAKPVPKLAPEPVDSKIDTITFTDGVMISGGPINYPINGIIDGVFIEDRPLVRIENLSDHHLPREFHHLSDSIRKNAIQPKIDSLLRPYYFSNYEVTNGEYREFIEWVADSIELHLAYRNLHHRDAAFLLDCSNKERKLLDSTKREENRIRFGLTRKNQKRIFEHNWVKAGESLYYPIPARFYRRREKNNSIIIYRQSADRFIPVYPDTNGFRISELGDLGDFLGNLSWHPAYANYPVVNLNSDQIMAYCHWKQRQLNEEFESKGYKITVRPPTITEYEFATKAAIGSTGLHTALDQSNDKFITNTRDKAGEDFVHYQSVYFDPFKRTKDRQEAELESSVDYVQWYQANQSDSPIKFLNGNVSEFVIDEVTPAKWQHYNITSPYPETSAHFVLGSNYITNVKTYSDDQYNAIFYKTALENGKSSPLIGFRLVCLLNPIPER